MFLVRISRYFYESKSMRINTYLSCVWNDKNKISDDMSILVTIKASTALYFFINIETPFPRCPLSTTDNISRNTWLAMHYILGIYLLVKQMQLIDYSFLRHTICLNKFQGDFQFITFSICTWYSNQFEKKITNHIYNRNIYFSFKHKTTSKRKRNIYIFNIFDLIVQKFFHHKTVLIHHPLLILEIHTALY